MRVALSILGAEVFAVETWGQPATTTAASEGSVTTTAFGFETTWHDKHSEHEETP